MKRYLFLSLFILLIISSPERAFAADSPFYPSPATGFVITLNSPSTNGQSLTSVSVSGSYSSANVSSSYTYICMIPFTDATSWNAGGNSHLVAGIGADLTNQNFNFNPAFVCWPRPVGNFGYFGYNITLPLGTHTVGVLAMALNKSSNYCGAGANAPCYSMVGLGQSVGPIPFTVVSTITPPPATPPTAIIDLPTTDQTITYGNDVYFVGTGTTDGQSWITDYVYSEYSCNATGINSYTPSSGFSYRQPSVGSHIIYLRVKNSSGTWSTNCPSRTITVTPAAASCTTTTINNCNLGATSSGGSGGYCTYGYDGSCSYTCTDGIWNQNSNSCTLPPVVCTATTNNNCVLPTTVSGNSAGSCTPGYTGSCNYSCSQQTWSQNSNSCTPPTPDLTVTADTTVVPALGIPGQSEPFSATVKNIGTGGASNFPNIFQIANSNISATIARVNTGTVASLVASASTGISGAYTFASSGTYNVRACANMDTSGNIVITESNSGNNCGAWQTITVSYPPLTVSCSGTPGNPFFNQPVTWSSTVTGGSGSHTYSWSGDEGLSGTTSSVQKSYASTGVKQATINVTDTNSGQTGSATCSTGTNQPDGPTNGGSCTTGVCPGSCTASLSAIPDPVEQGDYPRLSWSVTGGSLCVSSCTGSGFNTGGAISGNNVPASVAVSPSNNNYAITCDPGPYGPSAPGKVIANTTVTVLVPKATLTANGQSVTARVNPSTANNTTIAWSSEHTTSCSVIRTPSAPGWPKTGLSSAGTTDTVIAQTVYAIDCVNSHGTHATGSVMVNVLTSFNEF